MSDYLILSQDTPVAKWENNRLTVLNEQMLPLFLKRVANADMWLETRAIDSHRANSRLLKKALRELSDICEIAVLEVSSQNLPALRLYEKTGFTVAERLEMWYHKSISD